MIHLLPGYAYALMQASISSVKGLWEHGLLVGLVLTSERSLSAKLYLRGRVFIIHLLIFFKPAWCSNLVRS